jgi:hypothetical protein
MLQSQCVWPLMVGRIGKLVRVALRIPNVDIVLPLKVTRNVLIFAYSIWNDRLGDRLQIRPIAGYVKTIHIVYTIIDKVNIVVLIVVKPLVDIASVGNV